MTSSRWDDAPLGSLIDHIVATYHRPLPGMLARLQVAAHRALGDVLDDRVEALRLLLVDHMQREEELVFPWLRRRDPATAGVLVSLLEHDHGDVVRQVHDLQRLADAGLAVAPRGGRSLMARLRALDAALRAHIHLENDVLFPRALATGAGNDD